MSPRTVPHLKVVVIDWAVSIPMPSRADTIRTIKAEDTVFLVTLLPHRTCASASTESVEDKSIEFKRSESIQTETPQEN